jgi:hypothetical protein
MNQIYILKYHGIQFVRFPKIILNFIMTVFVAAKNMPIISGRETPISALLCPKNDTIALFFSKEGSNTVNKKAEGVN